MPSRILVIDDSPTMLDMLAKGLAAAGFDVSCATDLATLDAKLASGPFDLVLIDIKMPEMYGDDVVEFLRKQRNVTAKLILHSDLPEQEIQAKAQASGADGYVLKSAGLQATIAECVRFLPKPEPPLSPQSTVVPSASADTKRKKRVLIVDDSEVTASLIEADLKSKGFDVWTADSADKATRIILKKQTRPDLVLLDVRMPNVNGEQFCRFIKGNSLFAGIKVLLCSGENAEELQRICREAGADGYVAKDAVLGKVLARELP